MKHFTLWQAESVYSQEMLDAYYFTLSGEDTLHRVTPPVFRVLKEIFEIEPEPLVVRE